MPPFVSNKRRDDSSSPGPPQKRPKTARSAKAKTEPTSTKATATKKKADSAPTLFNAIDNPKPRNGTGAEKLFADAGDYEDSGSEADSDEFEDVAGASNQQHAQDDDDEIWEDALQSARYEDSPSEHQGAAAPLELNLGGPSVSHASYERLPGSKKQGPSKKDKRMRNLAHCMHVQYLMWHNHVRNHWLNDRQVQTIMVAHMQQSQKMKIQHENWKKKSGSLHAANEHPPSSQTLNAKGRKGRQTDSRSQRDWGKSAEHQAVGQPDLSRGDPLQHLLTALAAWWKQRFTITAPGIRKRGYKPLRVLRDELQSWRQGKSDIRDHGERIDSLQEFRSCAKRCEGSRDVGAQLFTSLLRGLGIEARLVNSLQPLGYGWSKFEDAELKPLKEYPRDTQNEPVKTPNSKRRGKETKSSTYSSKEAAIKLSDTSDLSALQSSAAESDSDISVIDITPKKRPNMPFDRDLLFPTYWTEAISLVTHRVFPVDPFLTRPPVATAPEHLQNFQARGAKAEQARQVFAYVVAFSSDYSAKDVTTRYLKNHVWPGKTKGFRMQPVRAPVTNRQGKVVTYYEVDWWQSVLLGYKRPTQKRTAADELEDRGELKAAAPEKKAAKEGDPETLDGYKRSLQYVLQRHLRREEAILPSALIVKTFRTGKGDSAADEPVYLRKDVVPCKTSESWHKEGRQVKAGEQPLKMVPIRAVTLTRKREIEELERETGEKATQGLYSKEQTEWIIPLPIQNGVIPKNAYGNMDAFVPQMIPRGAAHIPLRGTAKVCKKLGIDFAEAVTGFEFGNKMAVPVIEGVVVAEDNRELLIDAWEKAEEERKAREALKHEKQVLSTWRKFLMGIRVLERMKAEYEVNVDGHLREEANPFTNKKKKRSSALHEGSVETFESPLKSTPTTANGNHHTLDEAKTGAGGFFHENEEKMASVDTIPHAQILSRDDFFIERDEDENNTLLQKRQAAKVRSLADVVAQQTGALEFNDGDQLESTGETNVGGSTADTRQQRSSTRPQSQGRKRGSDKVGSRNVQNRPTSTIDSDGDEESPLSSWSAESSREALSSSAITPPLQAKRATRASTRSAAKASQGEQRSHFFNHESEAVGDRRGGGKGVALGEQPKKRGRPRKTR